VQGTHNREVDITRKGSETTSSPRVLAVFLGVGGYKLNLTPRSKRHGNSDGWFTLTLAGTKGTGFPNKEKKEGLCQENPETSQCE